MKILARWSQWRATATIPGTREHPILVRLGDEGGPTAARQYSLSLEEAVALRKSLDMAITDYVRHELKKGGLI